jgi:hypothetical protein
MPPALIRRNQGRETLGENMGRTACVPNRELEMHGVLWQDGDDPLDRYT